MIGSNLSMCQKIVFANFLIEEGPLKMVLEKGRPVTVKLIADVESLVMEDMRITTHDVEESFEIDYGTQGRSLHAFTIEILSNLQTFSITKYAGAC